MKTYILILTYLGCAILHAQSPGTEEQPIGFVEKWVLSKDRSASLKQLVPGTDDYFFYHALHYQQTKQREKFIASMDEWSRAFNKNNDLDGQRFEVMRKRGIILDYDQDPQGSIKQLTNLLNVHLDHQRPIPPEEANIPSTLDPDSVSEKAFLKQAASKGQEYKSYSDHLIPQELKKSKNFNRTKRLWFLKKINRADYPEVAQLVLAELRETRKPRFSNIPGTKHLFLDQLVWLETQHPALREDAAFVKARLNRLKPGNQVWQLRYPKKTLSWLQQSWQYCATLPPKHNSLKAHILYQLLDTHRHQGTYPSDLFLQYIQLPRISSNPLRIQKPLKSTYKCNLSENFTSITDRAPINIDNNLVIDYLDHLLANKDDSSPYSKYFYTSELVRIHAEARMMAGADSIQWGKQLSPELFRAFRDRTEVTLGLTNKKQWSENDNVALQLDLKNTPRLSIRVFEIDALSHIRRTGEDPSVDIKLNGLVPHHEQTIEFKQSPLVRHRHDLKLPQLKGRGIWIVECISKGVSCRSLVRKGSLQLIVENTGNGQSAMIFDENQDPVHPSTIWIRGRSFGSDKNGNILLPFAAASRTDQAVIHVPQFDADEDQGSGLAAATEVRRLAQKYELAMSAGTDLEQLLAGNNASILVRPKLMNNGKSVSLALLKKPQLHIRATLNGKVTTEISDLSVKIPTSGIVRHPISLPEDVRSITITFSGEIPRRGDKNPIKISATNTLKINGVNDTIGIAQPMLSRTTKGWRIDLIGRNGEPLANRTLHLKFSRWGFTTTVKQTFRTDANGHIHLGVHNGLYSVAIEATDFSSALSGSFYDEATTLPDEIHALVGEPIRLLYSEHEWLGKPKDCCGLYNHNGNPEIPVASMNKHLTIADGFITINNLPAGDYILKFSAYGASIPIRVIKGKRNGAWLSDQHHTIEHSNPQPLRINTANVDEKTLTASIAGGTQKTRVIAIGSRYFRYYEHFSLMHLSNSTQLTRWAHAYLGNETLNGRTLSDEYRYILERRAAKHYPGNMLPRPGLILNRWKTENSDALSSSGGTGSGGIPAAMKKRSKKKGGTVNGSPSPNTDSSQCFDFLSQSSVIRTDIPVNADGTVSLPLKDFVHCQKITLIAFTEDDTATRIIPLAPKKLLTRERRLDRNLNPAKHYIGTQATAILKKDASAEIENVLDADWRAYTELGHVYDYFHANNGNPQLRDFVHMMQWPKLNEKQRRGASQLLASHEFHLFAYFKDRKWFDTNIKPVLAHKRHRTFIDNFLLGNDLKPYLDPWPYQRLNAAEKALLARALPESRSAIVKDLTHSYERNYRGPEYETLLFASALKQNSLALRDRLGFASKDLARLENAERRQAGVIYIQQKLNAIILPVVDFEKTTIAEALDFLKIRSNELSPDNGIDFVIKGKNIANLRIDELKLKNVPLGIVLQYICDKTRLRYRLTSYSVELLPLDSLEAGDMGTRSFVLPPDFMAKLDSASADGDDDGPFDGGSAKKIRPKQSAKELLMSNGVSFPDNSFATYVPATSTLVVHNTLGNLDVIEQITDVLRCAAPYSSSRRLTTIDQGRASMLSEDSKDDPFGGSDDAFSAGGDDDGKARLRSSSPAEEPDDLLTHIWSESNYYRHPNTQEGPVINPSRFWIEFAKHDGKSPFLSAHFIQCNDSTASMLIALVVMDLPFEGKKPEAKIDKLTLEVKAKSPMLLFYRDMRETDKVADSTPLLVRQNFFRHGDRLRIDAKGREVENTVAGEFLTGVPYTASFIITNPTGTPRELQVLTQIPRGAIPLEGAPGTEARDLRLEKHGTTRVEYSFYFPKKGTYPHYPAHVLEDGIVQAAAKAAPIRVLAKAEKEDLRSWAAVARDGTDAEVLTRLATANLNRTPLHPILWRLAQQDFYQKLITLLKNNLYYDAEVYAYGLKHGDESAVRTLLENEPLADGLGAYIDSKLLKIDNRKRGHWEHLEFAPLVNSRQHNFKGHRQMFNQQAKEQYLTILDSMAWKPAATQDDLLTLTYHLFLQDRIEEALDYFGQIKRDNVLTKMQYDYLHCYALFYQEKPAEAASIAAKWTNTPSVHWARRFGNVATQAKEIARHHIVAAPDKAQTGKGKQPAHQLPPSISIASADKKLAINYTGITKASLRLYAVDLEVLFSENPFLDKQEELNPSIRPNVIIPIQLPVGQKKHTIDLPEKLSYGNVLAMIESGPLRKALALDSNALQINRNLATKTIAVTRNSDGAPLPRCYIKIYIEKNDGTSEFFKDGYTDLRGMFPYEAHTRIAPHQIKRYAIFASHTKLGSKITTYR